jgi:hypothetical protein
MCLAVDIGNKISIVENLSTLCSLTELNLRRNNITHIYGLHALPALQRIFLSHNYITSYSDIQCILNITRLIELTLDNNPIADRDSTLYRCTVLAYLQHLTHLDLKIVTAEERNIVNSMCIDIHQYAYVVQVGDLDATEMTIGSAPDQNHGHGGGDDRSVRTGSNSTRHDYTETGTSTATTAAISSAVGMDGYTQSSRPPKASNHHPIVSTSKEEEDDVNSHIPARQSNGMQAVSNGPHDGMFEAKTNGGWAALARTGKISKNQPVFDIEVSSSNSIVSFLVAHMSKCLTSGFHFTPRSLDMGRQIQTPRRHNDILIDRDQSCMCMYRLSVMMRKC